MPLFLRENPFFESTHSLLSNNKGMKDFNEDYILHSLIPSSFGFGHGHGHGHGHSTTAISRPHFLYRHHRFSPYKTLEKQLCKELLHNHDVFKLVDFSPKINVSEDDDHYYIHADLPGMTKDQVKMEISPEDYLFILSGERKSVVKESRPKIEEKEEKVKVEKDQIGKDSKVKVKETEKKSKSKNKGKGKDKNKNKNKNRNEITTTDTATATASTSTSTVHTTDNSTKKFSLMECHYGKFKRSFTLPKNVDLDHITAKMENGELDVNFNKLEFDGNKHQHRTIQIQ